MGERSGVKGRSLSAALSFSISGVPDRARRSRRCRGAATRNGEIESHSCDLVTFLRPGTERERAPIGRWRTEPRPGVWPGGPIGALSLSLSSDVPVRAERQIHGAVTAPPRCSHGASRRRPSHGAFSALSPDRPAGREGRAVGYIHSFHTLELSSRGAVRPPTACQALYSNCKFFAAGWRVTDDSEARADSKDSPCAGVGPGRGRFQEVVDVEVHSDSESPCGGGRGDAATDTRRVLV